MVQIKLQWSHLEDCLFFFSHFLIYFVPHTHSHMHAELRNAEKKHCYFFPARFMQSIQTQWELVKPWSNTVQKLSKWLQ